MEKTKNLVINRFNQGRDYAKAGFFDTWEDCWRVYNNKRTARSNYESVADTFVPETFTIVESILANVAGGKPQFEFYPTREEQNADTQALNDLVDFYWDQNRLGFKVIPWIRDSIIYGTGVLFIYWHDKGIGVRHIPLRDFFIDPHATVLDDPIENSRARYAGFRYLTTVEELKKVKVTDPETGESKRLYKNLNKIKKAAKPTGEPLDKEEKDMLMGSTLQGDARDDQVEVIYYVDREKVVEIANREVVIRDEETPFKREAETVQSVDDFGQQVEFELPEIEPFLPFASLRNYIDGSMFYAKGDVEVILDVQEHLNDVSNQKTDNLSYILNRMFTLDPAYADKIEEIDSVPGAIFTVPPGALDQIPTQPIGQDADMEMARSTDMMRRATAADAIVQGASVSKSRTTATEIQEQLAQAGTRFSMKLNVLETEGYAQLASIMFNLIQINVDQEMAVRKIGPRGVEWRSYNPGEFLGDYEPKVMLDTTARIEKESERQKWMEFFQVASNLPFVDQQYLFIRLSEKLFDIDQQEAEAFIQQQAPPPQPEQVPQGVTPSDVSPEMMQQMGIDPIAQEIDPMIPIDETVPML